MDGSYYHGAWGMGLVAMMEPATHSPAGAYLWGDGFRSFAVTVRADGFLGDYFAPAGSTRRPALLLIGGSEGGAGPYFLATMLAASGYPSLAIA